jgi:uncharacterized lipoprotein YehR (DUF1307 family)
MKTRSLAIVLASVLIVALTGCATKQTPTPAPFQPVQLNPDSYVKKVDVRVHGVQWHAQPIEIT